MASLTVLGSSAAWPEQGRACSGYLLESDGFRMVLDLGYATLPRLLAELGSSRADGLDGVLLTHAHADHAIDLHGLYRARWYGGRRDQPLPLIADPAAWELLHAVEAVDGEAREAVEARLCRIFTRQEPRSYAGGQPLGPWQVTSVELPHYVTNHGYRLESERLSIAYTGDTGASAELARLGCEVDLFIVECTDYTQLATPKKVQLHLDARLAGQAATRARAQRLLLTHFWAGVDRQRSAREAAEEFDGEILIADEGLRIEL